MWFPPLSATVPGAACAKNIRPDTIFALDPPPEPAVKPVLSLPKDLVERTVARSTVELRCDCPEVIDNSSTIL